MLGGWGVGRLKVNNIYCLYKLNDNSGGITKLWWVSSYNASMWLGLYMICGYTIIENSNGVNVFKI